MSAISRDQLQANGFLGNDCYVQGNKLSLPIKLELELEFELQLEFGFKLELEL